MALFLTVRRLQCCSLLEVLWWHYHCFHHEEIWICWKYFKWGYVNNWKFWLLWHDAIMDLLEFAWKLSQICKVFPTWLKNLLFWQHISGIDWPTKEEVCIGNLSALCCFSYHLLHPILVNNVQLTKLKQSCIQLVFNRHSFQTWDAELAGLTSLFCLLFLHSLTWVLVM